MNTSKPVPLVRHFSSVPKRGTTPTKQEILAYFGYQKGKSWPEIDQEYRSAILAEAGAGKTFEMLARARYIEEQGHPAFFIRIEDIDGYFEQAFEVGSADSFEFWLGSQSEAWFYLDSVDEARLDNPTAFEKAIRRFSVRIKDAQLRAHICISSRPYAWRPKSDREPDRADTLPFETTARTEPTGEDFGTECQPAEQTEERAGNLLATPTR